MAGLDRAEPARETRGARIAERGVAKHLMRERRPRLRLAHRREQAEHLHRLEHALHVGAAAIVAAEPEPHAGLAQIADRRDAALELHVGEMIEHDAGVGGGHAVHLGPRDPDAVHDVEPRAEQAVVLQIGDQRAVVIGELLARDQHLARASRRRGCRPADRASRQARRSPAASRACSAAARTAPAPSAACRRPGAAGTGARDSRAGRGSAGRCVPSISCTSAGRSSLWRTMAIGGTSQTMGENTTRSPALAIGVDHHVGAGVVERDQAQHVLHAGDAAADRFQRADERARPHLLLAAVGAQRQRVEQPHLQRQLLEQPAAERVVRMVVRVDQAGDDELAARVDDLGAVGGEPWRRRATMSPSSIRMSAIFGLWTSPSWS